MYAVYLHYYCCVVIVSKYYFVDSLNFAHSSIHFQAVLQSMLPRESYSKVSVALTVPFSNSRLAASSGCFRKRTLLSWASFRILRSRSRTLPWSQSPEKPCWPNCGGNMAAHGSWEMAIWPSGRYWLIIDGCGHLFTLKLIGKLVGIDEYNGAVTVCGIGSILT